MLKAQAGSTWGCDKETLLTTYQAFGRSILSYCCNVWTPSLNDTKRSRLQRSQISALRIATDCLKMADVTEIHQEVRELPVRLHNELIFHHLALECYLPLHPCHKLCHRLSDDRPVRRRSQIGRFNPDIQQYLAEEPLNNSGYMSAISSIHKNAVRTDMTEGSSSKVLNGRPPPIATAEQTPPRKTITILAQLRTGHSRILSQYVNRIDPTTRNHCHNCGHSSHDALHLFDCPSMPTTHTVASKYYAPNEAVKHLYFAIDETS